MMDGRNCTGHRISLLNDSGDVAGALSSAAISSSPSHSTTNTTTTTTNASSSLHLHHQYQQKLNPHHYHHRLPSLTRPDLVHSHSSSSTASSSSSASSASSSEDDVGSSGSGSDAPPTPLLIRSTSSDSQTYSSPSPATPAANAFETVASSAPAQSRHQYYHHPTQQSPRHASQQHYYLHPPAAATATSPRKMDDPTLAVLYPPIPDAIIPMPAAYQLPPQQMLPAQLPMQPSQQVTDSSNSPVSEPSRASVASNKKTPSKKNQYPCPMAKQIGCTDFFTTSGHAARHAKKHTGKKDAFCPECNKAFTRKDNMEQHRRTHQNGRGNGRSATIDDAKVKKSSKSASKRSSIKSEPQLLEAAVEQHLADPQVTGAPPPPMPIPIAAQVAQAQAQAQQLHAMQQQQQAVEQGLLIPPSGPYFLNAIDTGPIPSLPNIGPDLTMRPTLHRSSFAASLDYVPPLAPLMGDVNDPLHFSYPSPGLSNGLNSLALASEHRRLSEERARESPSEGESPSQDSPSQGTPTQETP